MKKIFLYCVLVCMVVFYSCRKNINDNATEMISASTIVNVHETAIQQMNEQLNNGSDISTVVNNCIVSINQSPDVKTAYIQDDNIIIEYNNGSVSIIALISENGESEKTKSMDLKYKDYKIAESKDGTDLITNHNVLIWEPFFDGFSFETYTGDFVQRIFENSSIDFNVTHLTKNQCTLTSLNNLTQYGFVYIKTHGGVKTENGEDIAWIVTGEEIPMNIELPPLGSSNKVAVTIAEVTYGFNSEINRIKTHGGYYWGITNKYITKYVNGQFNSPAIVYLEACCSYSNNAFRNAFIENKKASAYLGFKNPKTMTFGFHMALQFLPNLLNHNMDAYQAYSSITDTHDHTWTGLFLSLIGRRTEFLYSSATNTNPTYYGQENYVECTTRNKRWTLNSSQYHSNMDQIWVFSQLQMLGDSVQVVFRLSKMNNMDEGTYNPFVVNTIDQATEWENNCNIYPMRFVTGTYIYGAQSYIEINSEDENYRMLNGQLEYQRQNNQNKYIFDFTDENGDSYHGEYTE